MSLETVLKNLYRFLEVLQNSRSETVASWDKQSVDNAFKWAEYAEMIFRHSQGKTYAQQLDAEICKLGDLPWALESCKINLAFLQHSRQHLKYNLLQNCHIRLDLILNLFRVSNDAECEKLAEECTDLVSSERLTRMLLSTADFKGVGDDFLGESFESHLSSDPVLQTEVESLLDHLRYNDNCSANRKACHRNTSVQTFSNQGRQKERLNSYNSTSRGFVVSAAALILAAEMRIDHQVCDLLLDSVTATLCRNEIALFTLPSFVLIGLCNQHSNILIQYLDYITQCGNALLPDYDHIYVCDKGVRITWRCDPKHDSFSYELIKTRLIQLLKHGSSLVGVITKKTLQDLSEAVSSKPYVWTDLLQDIESDIIMSISSV